MEHPKLRTAVLILFFISFSWMNCRSQDSAGVRIEKIRMECDRINKTLPALKVVEEEIDDQSTEGGGLKKFYAGDTLRKAVLSLFGETGKSVYEYYFLDNELIFVFQKEITYKVPIYMGKTETKSEETDKFYFHKQKLELWIDNTGKPMDPALYPEKEKEFLNDLRNIINKDK